jgi:hypothetical protein
MTTKYNAVPLPYERKVLNNQVVVTAKNDNTPKPRVPAPFQWVDPSKLKRRDFVYSTVLIRMEVCATLAPGGVGKTSLLLVEAIVLASGKPLLGITPRKRERVWIWNGEEPLEEMQRRIMAICKHFKIEREDLDGYLFVNTAETLPLVVAEQAAGDTVTVFRPVVEQLIAWLKEHEIGVLFLDPFISTHSVNENSNNAIQKAATAWKEVAQRANVAISIAHHTRKLGDREATAEDSRGAKSFTDKCRVVRVLNPMTASEADRYGIEKKERRSFFSFDPSEMKANMAPATGSKQWFRTVGVYVGEPRGDLDPGDSVAVVTQWVPPTVEAIKQATPEQMAEIKRALEAGSFREDIRAAAWVGNVLAPIFGLNVAEKGGKYRTKCIVAKLIADRILVVVEKPDSQRKMKPFVELAPEIDCVSASVEVAQH